MHEDMPHVEETTVTTTTTPAVPRVEQTREEHRVSGTPETQPVQETTVEKTVVEES